MTGSAASLDRQALAGVRQKYNEGLNLAYGRERTDKPANQAESTVLASLSRGETLQDIADRNLKMLSHILLAAELLAWRGLIHAEGDRIVPTNYGREIAARMESGTL